MCHMTVLAMHALQGAQEQTDPSDYAVAAEYNTVSLYVTVYDYVTAILLHCQDTLSCNHQTM